MPPIALPFDLAPLNQARLSVSIGLPHAPSTTPMSLRLSKVMTRVMKFSSDVSHVTALGRYSNAGKLKGKSNGRP